VCSGKLGYALVYQLPTTHYYYLFQLIAMVSLSQARDMFKLQKQAKKMKKELKKIQVEAEAQGVKVVVTAEQEIVSITIGNDVPREKIPELLKDALNRALNKAQVVASEKMQGIMGDMGMPTEAGLRGMSE